MATDPYTKTILAIVAACLVLLVAQGFGLVSAATQGAAPSEREAVERYRIFGLARHGIMRMDLQTGESWKLKRDEMAWERIEESSETVTEPPVVPEPGASAP